ncbi:MAG: T9SS type A sorting domain-containing protein [Saprospiraceae bacterium]
MKVISKVVYIAVLSFLFTFLINALNAQFSYTFQMDTIRIAEEARLHSFSYGRIGDSLFIFGGRTDGIHDKASGFESNHANKSLVIFNTNTNTANKISLSSLDTFMLDAISSSNANFCQKENKLIIIGGYGQNSLGKYTTYPSLIQLDLIKLVELIQNNQNISLAFTQIRNDTFAIAGGQLKFIQDNFYLVGGHNFQGKYSNKPLEFKQTYSESAYVFSLLEENGILKSVIHNQIRDELNFHRRDFNLAPFQTSKNTIEPVAFSGVFTVNESRPFLNISSIQKNGYTDIPDFNQKLANYQCAHIGFYSTQDDVANEVFFGGMAEYYLNNSDSLIHDLLVPFVKTISRIERNQDGSYQEFALKEIKMPGFLGTNSEFILDKNISLIHEGIIDIDQIKNDINIGCIIGGIYNTSIRLNPWQDSMISLTTSNPYFIKVRLVKRDPNLVDSKILPEKNYPMHIFPNPADDFLNISFNEELKNLSLWILNTEGKLISYHKYDNTQQLSIHVNGISSGQYHCYYLVNNVNLG